MSERPQRVYTIASDAPFLDILAKAVLRGFPYAMGHQHPSLAAWTILVPTRRAARELQDKLLIESGKPALVLPQIRPIGDLDEDVLEAQRPYVGLLDAISDIGREFALIDLIDKWAAEHPQLRLAQELAQAPQQTQSLAASLAELIDVMETEEVSFDRLPEAYLIDLAVHREAILSLFDLVSKKLPAQLVSENLMGARERRSRLIRLEARRLIENPPAGPIIAAGSTGTIPATRDLLKAISTLENGAVILPALDEGMDAKSWDAVSPQHPQFAIKQLIEAIGVEREDIITLGTDSGDRAWLASELMRPSEVSDDWQQALAGQGNRIKRALENVSLVEARDKNDEASIIALMMRQALEKPVGDMALVTPDRDLARRVKANLSRWNIVVDDSAGEPLSRFGAASLLVLLMDAAEANFSASALQSLFSHPYAKFGFERAQFSASARHIEVALFRSLPMIHGLEGLLPSLDLALKGSKGASHPHPIVAHLKENDWQEMRECLARVVEILSPLAPRSVTTFREHLDGLMSVAEKIAGREFWDGPEAEDLETLVESLRQESPRLSVCSFQRAGAMIRRHLQRIPVRDIRNAGTRLSILGLLEARLVHPQTVILGGLNEGAWPRLPDPGPWLNRPMRDVFGMRQPERSIGQEAHDFVQAFGAPQVFLTWARRDGMDPAIPSRWILRLQTILKAAGHKPEDMPCEPWQAWAARLDGADNVRPTPHGKPQPRPPVDARPKRISVSRVETLIRDPYAIYADAVLKLKPLPNIAAAPDAALRGTLFHKAIGDFFTLYPRALPADAVEKFIALGEEIFRPFRNDPEIMGFWWARFQRLARWIVANEALLRSDVAEVFAEVRGNLILKIGETDFTLSGRADRIDILANGMARIVDFKTGAIPSGPKIKEGFSPQLTLEAAMLERGAFEHVGKHETSDLTYIRITGGIPPGELKSVDLAPMDVAREHLARLKGLLEKYQNPNLAYLPRFAIENVEAICDYDHLSRYREWILAGDS
ncbi:MAG: double-strand break repair protein AddB [Aestuariivirga sp.]|nr:double-strand break repair protein AddB [Aestuariivirga sp.]